MANNFQKINRTHVLNYILEHKATSLLNETTDILFKDSKKVNAPDEVKAYRDIKDYYATYGQVPPYDYIISKFMGIDENEKFSNDMTLDEALFYVNQLSERVEVTQAVSNINTAIINQDEVEYAKAKNSLWALFDKYSTTLSPSRTLYDLCDEYITYEEQVNSGVIQKIRSGIKGLDYALEGGFTETDYIVLVGQSGQGKSMIALRIAANVINQGYKVLYYNGEMNTYEVVKRMITFLSNGTISNSELQRATNGAITQLKCLTKTEAMKNFILCDETTLGNKPTPESIRRYAEKENVDLVIIDQAQWISPNIKTYGNDRDRLLNVSRDVRNAAKVSKIPFILLHQLNRGGLSGTGNKEEYIFGSDAFRQDACALLAYEYKKPSADDTNIPKFIDLNGNEVFHTNNNYARIQVLKARSSKDSNMEIFFAADYDHGEFTELKGDSTLELYDAFESNKDADYLTFPKPVRIEQNEEENPF